MPDANLFRPADWWSPLFLAAMLLLTAGYFVVIGPLAALGRDHERTRRGGGAEPAGETAEELAAPGTGMSAAADASPENHAYPPVPLVRRLLFVVGAAALYMAQGGPVSLLGHLMFSFHMLSMALSYLVAVPLMMLGIPAWVWRRLLEALGPLRLLAPLAGPIPAALLFNGLFSLYHLPAVHDYVMLHFAVHRIYYAVLFIASVLMWWTLIHPLPERRQPSGLHKVGYIFFNMVLLTPACGLIIFAGRPLYATYSDPFIWARAMGYCVSASPEALLESVGGPAAFALLSPRVDQQIGGIAMKFIQEFIFASMLGFVFYQWYKKENGQDGDEEPRRSSDMEDTA